MRYFIRIFIHIHMDIEIFHIEWKQLNFFICIKSQHGRQNDLFINFLINFFFLGGGCNELWVKFNQPALLLFVLITAWSLYPLHHTFTNQWSPLISITKLLLWALGLVSFIDSLLSVYTPGLDKTQRRTSTINTHQ